MSWELRRRAITGRYRTFTLRRVTGQLLGTLTRIDMGWAIAIRMGNPVANTGMALCKQAVSFLSITTLMPAI